MADAYDAMTSDRPYRKGLPADTAFLEVEKQSGRQFDPKCAAAFLAVREKIVQQTRSHSSEQVTSKVKVLQLS